ncbi:MAG: hypothetical protein ACOCYG_04525 [Spirochaetota bacterium]
MAVAGTLLMRRGATAMEESRRAGEVLRTLILGGWFLAAAGASMVRVIPAPRRGAVTAGTRLQVGRSA